MLLDEKKALRERQVKNIIKKLQYKYSVFVHDKRLLPLLKSKGLTIIQKIKTETYVTGGWCNNKGPVTPKLLLHWIKTGRLLKDDVCKYIDVHELFNDLTFDNAIKLSNEILEFGGGRGLLCMHSLLHKSEYYVTLKN